MSCDLKDEKEKPTTREAGAGVSVEVSAFEELVSMSLLCMARWARHPELMEPKRTSPESTHSPSPHCTAQGAPFML